MKKLLRFFYTVKDLRWQQLWYRGWHPLKRLWYRAPPLPEVALEAAQHFADFQPFLFPPPYSCQPAEKTFSFLNREKKFSDDVDWNFRENGLLWTFHLNYLDWLRDEDLSQETRMRSLGAYTGAHRDLKIGLASYPASVRIINIIRFLGQEERPLAALQLVWADACRVAAFPEKHLLANHFLENAFALFYAAHFFNEGRFYRQSSRWLMEQLKEQVLSDGGHFERSPAYHLHVLMRVLQCLELSEASGRFPDDTLRTFLKEKAALMLGWVRAFAEGNRLPHFGDSNDEMAPPPMLLLQLAEKLGVAPQNISLGASGYRKMQVPGWTVWLNAGSPAPRFQPGHSHADPLSFIAFYNSMPTLVNVGVSTYENNSQRHWERSTAAHSTPVFGGHNASGIWKAFRMGRKAVITLLKDTENEIIALHDGYKSRGIMVKCTLKKLGERLQLAYQLQRNATIGAEKACFHLYFAPGQDITVHQGAILTGGRALFQIKPNLEISLSHYSYAPGFYLTQNGTLMLIEFQDSIEFILMPFATHEN